eukprot:GAHX01003098.1.p1 GENE.GAHX01003098.1~~GAHX01003098.1.p1  ORF type:complete len:859 (-),score=191.54 GAHX01003098.1:35-2611(-)
MQEQHHKLLNNFYSGGQIYISSCNEFGYFWNDGMVYKVCLDSYSIKKRFLVDVEEENESNKFDIITYCIDEDQSIMIASVEDSRLYIFDLNTSKILLSFVQEPLVKMFYLPNLKILIGQNINNKIWLYRNINEKSQKKTHLNVQNDTTLHNKTISHVIGNEKLNSITIGFNNGVVINYNYEKYDTSNLNQLILKKQKDPLCHSISFLHYITEDNLLIVSGCIYQYNLKDNKINVLDKIKGIDDEQLKEINNIKLLTHDESKSTISFIMSTGNSAILKAVKVNYKTPGTDDYILTSRCITFNSSTNPIELVKEIVTSKKQFIVTDSENRIYHFKDDLSMINSYYCDNHYVPENMTSIELSSTNKKLIVYNHPDTMIIRNTDTLDLIHFERFSHEIVSVLVIKGIILILDTNKNITKLTIKANNENIQVSRNDEVLNLDSICDEDLKGFKIFETIEDNNGITCYLLLQLKLSILYIKVNLNTFKIESFDFKKKQKQSISVSFNEELQKIDRMDLIAINFKERSKNFKLILIKFENKIKLIKLKHKNNILYSYKIINKFNINISHKKAVDYFIDISKFNQTNKIEIIMNTEKRLSKHIVLYKERKFKCSEKLISNTIVEPITSLSAIKMGNKIYNCSIDVNFELVIYKEENNEEEDNRIARKNMIKLQLFKDMKKNSHFISIYSHIINSTSNDNVYVFMKDNKETLHLVAIKDTCKEEKKDVLNEEKEKIEIENDLDKLMIEDNKFDINLTDLVLKVIRRPSRNYILKISSLNEQLKNKVNLKSIEVADCEELFRIVIKLEDLQFIQSIDFVNFVLENLLFKRNNVKINKTMKGLIEEIKIRAYQQYKVVNELQKQYQVLI